MKLRGNMKTERKAPAMRELSAQELLAVGGGEIIGTGSNGQVRQGGSGSLGAAIGRFVTRIFGGSC